MALNYCCCRGSLRVIVRGAKNLHRGMFETCNSYYEARSLVLNGCTSYCPLDQIIIAFVFMKSSFKAYSVLSLLLSLYVQSKADIRPKLSCHGFVLRMEKDQLHHVCIITVKNTRRLRADRVLGQVSYNHYTHTHTHTLAYSMVLMTLNKGPYQPRMGSSWFRY